MNFESFEIDLRNEKFFDRILSGNCPIHICNRISPSQMAKLKRAESTSDIDDLFAAPEVFTVTAKAELNEQLPENYKPVLVFCAEDELELVRGIIEWNVCADSRISEQTKDMLRKMFADKR